MDSMDSVDAVDKMVKGPLRLLRPLRPLSSLSPLRPPTPKSQPMASSPLSLWPASSWTANWPHKQPLSKKREASPNAYIEKGTAIAGPNNPTVHLVHFVHAVHVTPCNLDCYAPSSKPTHSHPNYRLNQRPAKRILFSAREIADLTGIVMIRRDCASGIVARGNSHPHSCSRRPSHGGP